jgi:regulator of protease activity HflC (stomatin/prohibitin superfamily)
MDVYIYTEGVRKVKGEEQVFLSPLAELEDFESIDAALEALVDEAPDLLGTEFVIFTQQPEYVTVEPPPETKYSFSRRNGSQVAVEEEPEVVEPEDEEPEAPAPTRRRPAAKKPAAKKAAAKKRPAAKSAARGGARAGTRTGSSKRTPFTKNAASAE